MVQIGPFSVTINDHKGDPLPEYVDPDSQGEALPNCKRASCYVQTPPEDQPQFFEIEIKATDTGAELCAKGYCIETTFDGVKDNLSSPLTEQQILDKDLTIWIDTFCVRNKETGKYESRELAFSSFTTTEEQDDADGTVNKDELGEIMVEVYEILRSDPYLGAETHQDIEDDTIVPEVKKVYEKDVKGSSATHSVKLGAVVCADIPTCSDEIVYGPSLRTAIFKYRSKAALQTLNIIPADPLPNAQRRKENVQPEKENVRPKRENSIVVVDEPDAKMKYENPATVKEEIERPNKRKQPSSSKGGHGARKKFQVVDLTRED